MTSAGEDGDTRGLRTLPAAAPEQRAVPPPLGSLSTASPRARPGSRGPRSHGRDANAPVPAKRAGCLASLVTAKTRKRPEVCRAMTR